MSRADECHENLLFKAKALPEGYTRVVGRGEKGLKHLEFGLLRLYTGGWSGQTGEHEHVLNIHQGIISLGISHPEGNYTYQRLGGRKSVFDGPPTVVYLPPYSIYKLQVVEGPIQIGVFSATATNHRGEPTIILPDKVFRVSIGKDNWHRDSYMAIANNIRAAKLILTETITPPGYWSSAPPHKHDSFNPPNEVPMEEIRYFLVNPSQGFGVIRIYTGPNDPAPMDEIYVVENGDTVVIPRGYHIVGAAPGYTLHSTSALAGDIRVPDASTEDPRHSWVNGGNG